MEDNLQDKPRKELKQLCSQFNIRTAGVKHDELVRMLRSKLYPPVTETPRSPKARGQKITKMSDMQSPAKENGNSDKTPKRSSRTLRTLLHENESPREAGPAWKRTDSGLQRKPLLTKSNTLTSRRPDPLRKKVHSFSGIDRQSQENAYVSQLSPRMLQQIGSFKNRKSFEAPGHLESTPTSTTRSTRSGAGANEAQIAQTNGYANSEDTGSPRASEVDALCTAIEPSDAGSDGIRRGSEIASDAWPDTLSEFSDADEFRSVSSEPISRFSSQGNRHHIRKESSKLSLCSAQSGLSFFTARSGGSGDFKSADNLLESELRNGPRHREDLDLFVRTGRGKAVEDIFPDFLEGTDFLVGDTDGMELSFLDAGGADPEEIGRAELGRQDGPDHFKPLETPMARNCINYNRGTEKEVSEESSCSAGNAMAKVTAVQAASHPGGESETASPAGDAQSTAGADFSEEDARCQGLGPNGDGIPGEKIGAIEREGDIALGGWQHGDGSEDKSQLVPPAAPGVDGGDVESTLTTTFTSQDTDGGHIDGLSTDDSRQIEDVEPPGLSSKNSAREEAGNVPATDESGEIGNVPATDPHDSANLEDLVDEGRRQELGCNDNSSEEGAAAAPIPENVEGAVEELNTLAPEVEDTVAPERETSAYKWIRSVSHISLPAQDSAEEVSAADGASEHGPEAGHPEEVEAVAPVPADVQDAKNVLDTPAPASKETNVPELEAFKVEENRGEIDSSPLLTAPTRDLTMYNDFDDKIGVQDRYRVIKCVEDDEGDASVPRDVEVPLEEPATSSPDLENEIPSELASPGAGESTGVEEHGNDGEWDHARPELVGDVGESSIYTTITQNLEEEGPAGHESQPVEEEQAEQEASSPNCETGSFAELPTSSVKRHGSDDEEIPETAPPAIDDMLSDASSSDNDSGTNMSEQDKVGDNDQENWKEIADESDSSSPKSDHKDKAVLGGHKEDTGFALSAPEAPDVFRLLYCSIDVDDIVDGSESSIETSGSSKEEETPVKLTSSESTVDILDAESTDVGGDPSSSYPDLQSQGSHGFMDVDTSEASDPVPSGGNTEEGDCATDTSRSSEEHGDLGASIPEPAAADDTESVSDDMKGDDTKSLIHSALAAQESVDSELMTDKVGSSPDNTCSSGNDNVAALAPQHSEETSHEDDVSSSHPQNIIVLELPSVASDRSAGPIKCTDVSSPPQLDFTACLENSVHEKDATDVKASGEHEKTAGAVADINKDRREKEDLQLKVAFPLSIILWCSQPFLSLFGHSGSRR